MKKAERDRLFANVAQCRPKIRWGAEDLNRLRDYVDTLEAACKRAADLASVISRSDTREIYMILSEALDKGK